MTQFKYSTALFWICIAQAIYFMLTGSWPLVHIGSFEVVTGPKVDDWLVKTVGVLILAIGGVMLSGGLNRRISPEIYFLAIGSAFGLTCIDVYYATIDRISNIYLLDALAEILLILAWIIAWNKAKP